MKLIEVKGSDRDNTLHFINPDKIIRITVFKTNLCIYLDGGTAITTIMSLSTLLELIEK